MQLPPLNALRAFQVFAERGSMAAAAEELTVSSSAVSHQIRNLEKCLGLPLVTRNGRQVQLTEDGRALAGGLAEGFSHIADAVDRLHRPADGQSLRIVLPPIFATAWLFPRMERFSALRPETRIVLVDSRERVDVSARDEIVIDWGSYADDSHSLAERLSGTEEIFPVCAPGSCPGPGLSGATLLNREDPGNGWNWPDWPSFMEAVGLVGTDTVSGPSLTARLLLSAVRQGKGVILSNSTIARGDLAAGRLVRPIPESLPTDDGYWIRTLRPARRKPEVRAFVSWLKEEFARDSGQVT